MPSRQPEYRAGRAHPEFLVNLGVPAQKLKAALVQAWGAGAPLTNVPFVAIERLVSEKYRRSEWNLKF